LPVPGSEDPQGANFEEVSSSLTEGLRTCRSVVQSYRVLLVGDQPDASGEGEHLPADNDDVPGNDAPVRAELPLSTP
jgi:hypothetical protein